MIPPTLGSARALLGLREDGTSAPPRAQLLHRMVHEARRQAAGRACAGPTGNWDWDWEVGFLGIWVIVGLSVSGAGGSAARSSKPPAPAANG
jgi:hypothetical protein